MGEASGRLSERPHHVKVPHIERPCDGDCQKCLRREVGLSCVELAPIAAPFDFFGVCHCRGLVEPLSKSLPDKCSRACMMTASVGVYLL
jgi:hypothetical protein